MRNKVLRASGWFAHVLMVLAFLLCANATPAAELGYSITHQPQRDEVSGFGRGYEGRINFGNSQLSDRYSGDRWSLAIGNMTAREVHGDNWIATPLGCCAQVEKPYFDAYQYISFSHRWYTRFQRFPRIPQLRLFVGTGVAWRNVETCTLEGCWDGTPAVSNQWTFHQTFGIKWRERLELAWEHDSTGRISRLNMGDDMIRFTLYAHLTLGSR